MLADAQRSDRPPRVVLVRRALPGPTRANLRSVDSVVEKSLSISDMQRHSKPWRVATAALVVATAVAASTIDVRINAAWNQTPILAEASEAVAAFSPEAFWAFVDMTAPIAPSLRRQLEAEGETPPEPTATSPQIDQYARALSLLPALIFNEAQQKLARSELAARAFSPKVAAHHDLALQALKSSPDGEKCKDDAFFDFGAGRLICDAQRFDEAVQSGTTQCHAPEEVTLEGEHTLKPPASAAAAPGPCNAAAVLYGVLGTERTLQFVKLARTAAQKGTCTVTFRHYIANTSNLDYPLGVQGYGITIDVKNMEYKAVDEKKAVEENADSDAEVTLPPVEGMDVNLLAKRFPQLRANLTAFAQRATSSVNADLDLKVWEVQKLGIQAAHHVLADSNPMQSLTDLTENFPARVSIISRIPHDDALAQTSAAVTQLANYYGDGENRLWINKRHIDSNDHDLFSLLATLRKEETQYNKILSVLTGKSRPVADHNDAVTSMTRCPLNSPVGGEKPRLWINESLPYWINNIESRRHVLDAAAAHRQHCTPWAVRSAEVRAPQPAQHDLRHRPHGENSLGGHAGFHAPVAAGRCGALRLPAIVPGAAQGLRRVLHGKCRWNQRGRVERRRPHRHGVPRDAGHVRPRRAGDVPSPRPVEPR
jgi:hypothetical protein